MYLTKGMIKIESENNWIKLQHLEVVRWLIIGSRGIIGGFGPGRYYN